MKYSGYDKFVNEKIVEELILKLKTIQSKNDFKNACSEINSRGGYITMKLFEVFEKVYSYSTDYREYNLELINNKVNNNLWKKLIHFEGKNKELFYNKSIEECNVFICNNIGDDFSTPLIKKLENIVKFDKNFYVITITEDSMSFKEITKEKISYEDSTLDTKTVSTEEVEVEDHVEQPKKRKRNSKTLK